MLPSNLDGGWSAPRLRVLANGQSISGVIEAEVIGNNHYAADRFSVVVSTSSDAATGVAFWASVPDALLDVQFSIDGGMTFTSLMQGAVDTVSIDPVLALAHLEGRDLTAALIEARTQETFANRTASEIATILAGRHGLAAQVVQTTTPVGRYYQNEHDSITLDQFSRATTEWDLLVFLARREGFDVFVQGTTLYFQPQAQGADISVLLNIVDLTDVRLERSLTLARDIEVVVKSWNSRERNSFVQRARATGQGTNTGHGGTRAPVQQYVLVRPNLTPNAALQLAQQTLAELTRHERVVELGMIGDLSLTPRSVITLQGTGSEFDQTYFVDTIERRIADHGGFSQRIRAKNTSPRTETTPPTSDTSNGTAA